MVLCVTRPHTTTRPAPRKESISSTGMAGDAGPEVNPDLQ